jgi:hypothetical protein
MSLGCTRTPSSLGWTETVSMGKDHPTWRA